MAGDPLGNDAKWGDMPVYAIHGRNDEVISIAGTEAAIERMQVAGKTVVLVVDRRRTHFDTNGYAEHLQVAAPWIEAVWSDD